MALHVESVAKTLGDFSLHDVSFYVKTGEYFMILGPTGAGKTIVLETIAGIHIAGHGKDLLGWRGYHAFRASRTEHWGRVSGLHALSPPHC